MDKKEFEKRLKKNKLKLSDFATLCGLPYDTVTGWNRQGKNPPVWVLSWFDNYEKAKSYEYIKNKVFDIENITKEDKQD